MMSRRIGLPDGASEHRERATMDETTDRPLVKRARAMLVHASLVVFALALVARAVQV